MLTLVPSLGPLEEDESVARFLTSSGHFAKTKGTVKYRAFLPRPDDLTTSVFRVKGLPERKIRLLGNHFVREKLPPNRTLYGRGELEVADVVQVGLEVHPTEEPVRHADIVGWPDSKEERKSLAMQLEATASLHLRESA